MREASGLAFASLGVFVREGIKLGRLSAIVTLERRSPKPLDGDNWIAACKPVRDGIADMCGVPDNVPHLRWQYVQVKDNAKEVWAYVSTVPTSDEYLKEWRARGRKKEDPED